MNYKKIVAEQIRKTVGEHLALTKSYQWLKCLNTQNQGTSLSCIYTCKSFT